MQKKRVALIAVFLFGVIVGGVVAALGVGWHWNRNFHRWYAISVAGQAFTALQIREGHAAELADQIQASLPQYVEAIDRQNQDADQLPSELWFVAEFYEKTSVDAPPEVQAVLSRLPPRPASCCQARPAETLNP